MTRRWIRMLCFGSLFAVPISVMAFAFVRTSASAQFTKQWTEDCQTCHYVFQETWEASAHGQAAVDPAFREAWQDQGEPVMCMGCHTTGFNPETGTWKSEGVGCEVCHSPIQENHPTEPMPSDRSAALCGNCHTEAYFAWQMSGHSQENLDCIACHDPHETDLNEYDDAGLCAACHQTRASDFTHSVHSSEGLTCADCHLGPVEGDTGEGRALRDHSFHVRLATCTSCHAYQMHAPVTIQPEPDEAPEEADFASAEMSLISDEPGPVNPFGFALLAGLVGMASGMILSPWLERWYQRLNRRDE